MIAPSPPRLNWLAENMTQTARPEKMVGIMAAKMVRKLTVLKTLPVALKLTTGPTSKYLRAVRGSSEEMKMKTVATARANKMAARPRSILNTNNLLSFIAHLCDFFFSLVFQTEHVFAHDNVI